LDAVSYNTSVFAENMVDGIALANLTDVDISIMLPGKVGAARKLMVLLQRKKVYAQLLYSFLS